MSAQHVDRFQVHLDLCADHLKKWIDLADKELKSEELNVDANHGLSRAFMDAIVAQKSHFLEEKEGGLKAMTFNPVKGIEALHLLISCFIEDEKAKLPEKTMLKVLTSEN